MHGEPESGEGTMRTAMLAWAISLMLATMVPKAAVAKKPAAKTAKTTATKTKAKPTHPKAPVPKATPKPTPKPTPVPKASPSPSPSPAPTLAPSPSASPSPSPTSTPVFQSSSGTSSSPADNTTLLERFPDLHKFIAREKSSNLLFGFGLSPVTLVNGKIGFAASLFQLHYLKDPWDVELLNVSFGTAFGEQYGKEQFFLLRAAPKFKVYRNLSIGPLFGIEFVHFPDVQAELTKNGLFSQPFDFSTFGYFYGGAISQTFELGEKGDHALRVSAIYYKERYSVDETNNGWTYYFLQSSLNFDKSQIAPASMFMLEISYLY